jgi:hypothetical protein
MHPHTWCMDIDDMHAYHALASMGGKQPPIDANGGFGRKAL